jgi:hypothetical protein
MTKILKILFFIVLFLGGLYFYTKYAHTDKLFGLQEGLSTMNGELRCPNLLIQKDAKFYLYNSNIAEVPGVNPIEFNNLEDYVEFLEWQRGAGIRCPVLYVQNTYDAQGNRVYKMRPSVTELQGGLPPTTPVPLPAQFVTLPAAPSIVNPPYVPSKSQMQMENDNLTLTQSAKQMNEIMFDQSSYYTVTGNTGVSSHDNLLYSPNAMDDNWGGASYTQALVDNGYYAGNEVAIAIPP